MSKFRLVLLDYAKLQIENPLAQKALSDLIIVKQKNFERTDPNYVVIDKHDMIGTHALIYETSDLFNPRLIFALRVTFEDRAKIHNVQTPLQDLIPKLSDRLKNHYLIFQKKHKTLADCNSWFVDPNFSLKTSGLRLSDIGYTMVYLQVARMGLNHIIGCTNEKYKAHRWLENIGSFEKGYDFIHPVVPDPHMLVLIENFNKDYLANVYQENRELFDNLLEISPTGLNYKNIPEMLTELFDTRDFNQLKVS
jgi:hypothetical protein